MGFISKALILSISILVLQLNIAYSRGEVKSKTFLSQTLVSEPGLVHNKYFYDAEFPKGHVAIRSFDVELVDEKLNPVPLHEVYVHHWTATRYFQNNGMFPNNKTRIFKRNSGPCENLTMPYYWGLGGESRGVISDIPEPYGIEVGNPSELPKGYDEKWVLNVMTIDTRGAIDKFGCTECRCDLFDGPKSNFTKEYKGGVKCCVDNTRCKLIKGFQGPKKILRFRYTIKWVEWDQHQVPVRIHVIDVTDNVVKNGSQALHHCQLEYSIFPENYGPVNVKKANISIGKGGYLIYGAAHQHAGSVGATLYGQDGRVLCTSTPKYGKGKEAGNEKGYVVAMSECLPKPGSVKINDNEILTMESRYQNKFLTGLMGHFYILVAEKLA
ncbi:hypothetical protein RIF29_42294 [Crotalaria pallida]|uniref:Stress up-regulated Nod 19 protein n=1 Tax=Crotalaria pallida TaxID=3830 RepID=A0AAN9HSF2_CROPI